MIFVSFYSPSKGLQKVIKIMKIQYGGFTHSMTFRHLDFVYLKEGITECSPEIVVISQKARPLRQQPDKKSKIYIQK